MGLLLKIGLVWIGAGVFFVVAFKLFGLRYVVRNRLSDDQLFLPGMASARRRSPVALFRYARHQRPPSMRSRRATSLPTELI